MTATRGRWSAAALCIIAMLPLAACGKDPVAAPNGASANGPAELKPTTLRVDKAFWHAGWKVTLGEAKFGTTDLTILNPLGPASAPAVTFETTVENLGNDTGGFESQIVLSAGDKNYVKVLGVDAFSTVPGASRQKGSLVIVTDEGFRFDDAVLTVGRPENNQAVVPLGGSGALVSLEPVTVTVTGTAAVPTTQAGPGTLTIKVTGGELRADIPSKHSEVKKGGLALTLNFSVSWASGKIYDYVFDDNHVLLKWPDGTAVAPDRLDAVLLGPGATKPDQFVRFLTPSPASGAYVLVLKAENSNATAEIPIQIQTAA